MIIIIIIELLAYIVCYSNLILSFRILYIFKLCDLIISS